MFLNKIARPCIDFSIPWEKYIVRMVSKTSLSARITKAMSSLSHFTCYFAKVDLHPKKPCSCKILL